MVARRLGVALGHLAPHAAARERDELRGSFQPAPLKENGFGAVLEMDRSMLRRLLTEPAVGDEFRRMWQSTGGGLMVLRGLVDLTPEELVEVSNVFGEMEGEAIGGRAASAESSVLASGSAVSRLGNTRDETGRLTASFINAGPRLRPRRRRQDLAAGL